jgi:hypothetical protein
MRTTAFVIAVVGVVGLASMRMLGQETRVSPHETTSATVAGASMSVTYGRPSMRGRKIFGGLVPYDIVWCPGADEATVLDSNKALQIGNLKVPAGPHTIWVLPTAGDWTLIVSKDESGFHTRYPRSRDLGRVPFQKKALASPVEQLTFEIRPSSPTGGELVMRWETTEVTVPFTVMP